MSWYSRTELLIGEVNCVKLKQSRVLICGLGGVGGAVAEMLARAGIGNLSIVDADIISETNINRQLIATHENIGYYKVDAFQKRLLNINPEINLNIIKEYLKDEAITNVLSASKWNYVVDAIDTLSPKFQLIKYCYEHKIPVISSMGAGGKMKPNLVKIADISETYNCGLAKQIRKKLREINIYKGINVVFSSEMVNKESIVKEISQNKITNIGSISYMPNIFGCLCAYKVIEDIITK